jgi:nucleoside-diphosphate-sugar epimerase
MRVLVIGGTRNLGHLLVLALVGAKHRVTVLNRGVTRDELPREVERLRADRTDAAALAAALAGRVWDGVVDLALYRPVEAEAVVELLGRRAGHYVLVSTGQVYLVRGAGAGRPLPTAPYREEDAAGPWLPAPAPGGHDHRNWLYGVEKRGAERVLERAAAAGRLPLTIVRPPMIHTERDHYGRVGAYLSRLDDGGPLLLPAEPDRPLRHAWGGDVVTALRVILEATTPAGRAYNLAQDEAPGLAAFLELLGRAAGREPAVRRLPRPVLEAAGLLPACSPFSERWMSELENRRSREELGLSYTSPTRYLPVLVERLRARGAVPPGYGQRPRELALAATAGAGPA